jgi:hypothetical protein
LSKSTSAPRAEPEANDNSYPLAAEILRGARNIANFIGKDLRPTFYGLERGHIPGFKEGGVWTSTKSRLRAHYYDTTTRTSEAGRSGRRRCAVILWPRSGGSKAG